MVLNTHDAKRRRQVLVVVGVGVFMLVTGMVAGFFIAKTVGTYMLTHQCQPGGSPAASAAPAAVAYGDTATPGQFRPGSARAISSRFKELPEPGSDEAAALLAASQTDDVAVQLYTWFDDALLITEELTVVFLRRLEQQLAGRQALPGSDLTSMSSAELSEVVTTFVKVAKDVLAYLRHQHSAALLPMLRQFSQQGSVSLTDVNPDVLQREIQDLLNVTAMGLWYSRAAQVDIPSLETLPYPTGGGLPPSPATAELLVGDAAAPGGRHLLWHGREVQPQQASRMLHAAFTIPPIPLAEALQELVLPTESPLLSLEDMLCSIRTFSPIGLEGMYLARSNTTKPAKQPIKCKPQPELGVFQHGKVMFKPVIIPVVFHCQRFLDGDTVLPPMWQPEQAAKNLIDQANKHFKRAGIQFVLQEARYDAEKYPYLVLASLDDWQSCSGNPSQEVAGFPCLRETARFPEVAGLAEQHVINVLVGGSQSTMFCNDTMPADAVCNSLYLGYTGSIGPWYARPSRTWKEGKSDENWITITWDMFSPTVANSPRFWDGGGVTFAHELGHYLGLMHTHEGASPCEGEGRNKADAVPDTPTNLQTVQWAASKKLAVALAHWCSEFRNGKSPQPQELLAFKSCPNRPAGLSHPVDNLFNLLSYLPDQCCMMLTPNQVARLQWASATFRPKMMAAFYV